MFVDGKVEVMTHETIIMLLIGPNGWRWWLNPSRLYNKLNTHVVLFPGIIKLNFRDDTVLN